MNNKLDPALRARLRTSDAAKIEKEVAPATGLAARVDLIVEFAGELADLTAIGFEPRTVVTHPHDKSTLATGSIPVARLPELAAIEHLIATEGPRRYHPHLDYSVPAIHATELHDGTPPRTGKGVVVGIVDSGIDWRHGSFVDPDTGNSRILAIWDQPLDRHPGDTAGPHNVGVVYSQDQLTAALKNDVKTVRTRDRNLRDEPNGHGTHVAGIAAGNGRPMSCCHTRYTYVGVAPEADLIVVRYDYTPAMASNTNVVDAFDFIFNHPQAVGRPIVINLSQGENVGPHDGSSLVERMIDSMISGIGARAIVVSAGNHADERSHVKGTVPDNGSRDIEFTVREGHEGDAFVDIWYDRDQMLNLEIFVTAVSIGTVNHGHSGGPFIANPHAPQKRQCRVNVDGIVGAPFDRNNNFLLTLHEPDEGNLPKGDWTLTLTNPNATAVEFHCWIERGKKAPVFLEALKPGEPPDEAIRSSIDSTISTPSTARMAITVANHQNRTACSECHPPEDIAVSSGRGPVVRGADTNKKPDIAAPGLQIDSAKADAANLRGNCWSCCPDGCCCLYKEDSGTSMSAPHVAGTIALMLEANPRLTQPQILEHLQKSARPPPPGGTPETWGAGKLDAKAAVQRVLDALGAGGGGGGGGGPHAPMGIQREGVVDGPLPRHRAHHGEIPPGRIERSASAPRGRAQWPTGLGALRRRLAGMPDGEMLMVIISRHFSEVRRLVNTNRRVATMWHRAQGPLQLRRLIQGSTAEGDSGLTASVAQSRYVERWCRLLERYGSERLRAALLCYGERVMTLLASGRTGVLAESRTDRRVEAEPIPVHIA